MGAKQAASCGTWVYIDAFDVVPIVPSTIRIEEGDPRVARGPNPWSWNTGSDARASGATYVVTSSGGSTLNFTFTGTGVSVIGTTDSCGGQASVSIDNGAPQMFDSYRASGAWQQVLFSAEGLATGSHNVTLTALGAKQAASCGTWVYIDAFDVRP